jgi:hypothetical protein
MPAGLGESFGHGAGLGFGKPKVDPKDSVLFSNFREETLT